MKTVLNFALPTATQPHFDLTLGSTGGLRTEPREVALGDAAADEGDPRACLRERGFTSIPFEGGAGIDLAADDWRKRFGQAVLQPLLALSGANKVILVGPTLVRRQGDADDSLKPIEICHSDFTAVSATRRIARLEARHGPGVLERRFAVYNVWWLASDPPQDRPLALCDPRTAGPADMTVGSTHIYDRNGEPNDFGELALFRYNPRQRWFWYPELRSDRLLVFAGFDSDPAHASIVPHAAFANPACPPGAATRQSVECRCYALW